ncbi:MAG: protease complex subunit PrcB family protein [Granulosicoccus sp.]
MMNNYRTSLFVLLMTTQFLFGCSDSETTPQQQQTNLDQSEQQDGFGDSVNFTVLAAGSYFDHNASTAKRIEIYRDPDALNNAIAQFNNSLSEVTTDFGSNQAVLFTLGNRPTGGYSIQAESVLDFGDHIRLTVLTTVYHGNECVTTQAETHPYQVLEISSRKELIIQEQFEVANCAF